MPFMLRCNWLHSVIGFSLLLGACGGRTQGPEQGTESGQGSGDATSGAEDGSLPSGASSSTNSTGATVGTSPGPGPTLNPTAPELSSETTSPLSVDSETSSASEPDGEPVIVVPTPPVCADKCGNGIVDTCKTCSGGGGIDPVDPTLPLLDIVLPPPETCVELTEECDGENGDAGLATCDALGFAGGVSSCSDACYFDDSACQSCGAAPEVELCRDDLGSGKNPDHVGLATNNSEVVVAWNEGCAVNVGWFDAELEARLTVSLEGAPCALNSSIVVAPLGPLWVVEVGGRQFVLDGMGATAARRDVAGNARFAASRVDGLPLLVRETTYGAVSASLLDESGNELWTTPVSEDVTEAHYGSATAVEGGFLVALRTAAGVQVFHLDGQTGVIEHTHTPGSSSTEYPQVSATNGEIRLVWTEFGDAPGVRWARLDQTGGRVGDAVALGSTPEYFNRSPLVVDGADSVILLGGYTGGTGIGKATHLRRIDVTGLTVSGDVALQSDPNGVQWPQLIGFDGGFVAAWVGNGLAGRVGLAKVNL